VKQTFLIIALVLHGKFFGHGQWPSLVVRIINMQPNFLWKRFKIDIRHLLVMHVLVCLESGVDCDFIIKGETKEELLKNGADHATKETWY
jgi:hypothetical protein